MRDGSEEIIDLEDPVLRAADDQEQDEDEEDEDNDFINDSDDMSEDNSYAETLATVDWAQCDLCRKWRRLSPGQVLTLVWFMLCLVRCILVRADRGRVLSGQSWSGGQLRLPQRGQDV